jgi:dolichol kinase
MRALTHLFATFVTALVIYFLPEPWAAWLLAALAWTAIAAELLRRRYSNLNTLLCYLFMPPMRSNEWFDLTGATYIAAAAFALAASFPRSITLAALSYLAVGDAASASVNSWMRQQPGLFTRFARSLFCLLACTGAAIIMHLAGLTLPLWVLLLGAGAATAGETISIGLNDNLLMPFLAGLAMWGFVALMSLS